MGIGIEVNDFEKESLSSVGLTWASICMVELGNQKIKFLKRRISAKKYYQDLGIKEHVSIDLNKKNGSIIVDLDKPVPAHLLDRFNVVTNYGTLEHVNNQYQAFKNIHNMCEVGGVMLHSLPPPGHWIGHGRYYYPEPFFYELANQSGYNLISTIRRIARDGRELHDMLLVAFRKTETKFPDEDDFKQLPIKDSGDTSTTGNYTQKGKKRFWWFRET